MKKPYLLIAFLLFTSQHLFSQWTEHIISDISYEYDIRPIWEDLNGDGLLDIIGYDKDKATLFWQQNTGGTFTDHRFLALVQDFIKLADLDGDGDMDVMANYSHEFNEVKWDQYINDGSNNFRLQKMEFETQFEDYEFVDFEDMNGDGERDFVFRQDSFEELYIYEYRNGTYTYVEQYPLNENSLLDVVDWNQDGTYEITITDENINVCILSFDGRQLTDPNCFEALRFTPSEPARILINKYVDHDGDGDLDLLRVLRVKEHSYYEHYPAGHPDGRDGWSISVKAFNNYHQVLENKGTNFDLQTFHVNQTMSFIRDDKVTQTPYAPPNNFIGDLDGDGKIEWAMSSLYYEPQKIRDDIKIFTPYFQIYSLDEKNKFELIDTSNYKAEIFSSSTRISVDNDIVPIDDSGKGTLIRYYEHSFFPNALKRHEMVIANNTASGNIHKPTNWRRCITCPKIRDISQGFQSRDIDLDGDRELIVGALLNQYQMASIDLDVNCDFTIQEFIGPTFDPTLRGAFKFALGDLDRDDDIDIITFRKKFREMFSILLNNGEGSYKVEKIMEADHGTDEIFVEELNEDGAATLLSEGDRSRAINMYENIVDEVPNKEAIFPSISSDEIFFVDIDNDLDTDIIAYEHSGNNTKFQILRNEATEFVGEELIEVPISEINSIDLFDINNDDLPELIVNHDNTLSVYYNFEGKINFDEPNLIFESGSLFEFGKLQFENGDIGFLIAVDNETENDYIASLDINGNIEILSEAEDYGQVQIISFSNDRVPDVISVTDKISIFTSKQNSCISNEPNCALDTEGQIFYQYCNDTRYFLIRLDDGTILDPTYGPGVEFDHQEGQYVKFNYTEKDIATDCTDVTTVEINCIVAKADVPVAPDYQWLSAIIADTDACCDIGQITSYYNDEESFVYFQPKENCDNQIGTLYDAQGELFCNDSESFTCFAENGLQEYFQEVIWQCGEEIQTLKEQTCALDVEGKIFFQNCGDYRYFLIELEDGTILDPTYGPGVEFEHEEGQLVKFNYTERDIFTDCSDVKTVEINCIIDQVEIPLVSNYNWIASKIDDINSCCDVGQVTAYYNNEITYLYYQPSDDCGDQAGSLYDDTGKLMCSDEESYDCYKSMNLHEYYQEVVWSCGELISSTTESESVEITVYPNPTTDLLHFDNARNAPVKIYSATGELSIQTKVTSDKINVSDLVPGVYFISIQTSSDQINHARFVKI